MKADIITIGDELLIGQVVDSNSAWIAKSLYELGIVVRQITSISDDAQAIKDSLDAARTHVNLVIMTGGLGPTKDDITKHTLCDYLGDTLKTETKVLQHIVTLFAGFGKEITPLNEKQALVPSRADVLHNANGTAPGMWMQADDLVVVSLPGVPYEMKGIFKDTLAQKLKQHFKTQHLVKKTVLTTGIGESWLADKLELWENSLPDTVKLAYLPSPGRVRLRLSTSGDNRQELEDLLDEQIASLYPVIGTYIYGFEEEELAEKIGLILGQCGKTLSVAESCTGGALAAAITAIPGSSKYFKGGVVAYDTAIKTDVLNVQPESIKQYTVVSEKVAKEMALGVQKLYKSDYAIATTGVAGPSLGEDGKAVGTVCIALACPDNIYAWTCALGHNRERVITKSVAQALEYFRQLLIK